MSIFKRYALPMVLCLASLSMSFSAAALGQSTAPKFVDPVDDVVAVLELVDARLALMADVAAWKWREHRPVTDAEREARVIDSTVMQAIALGLDAAATREFFTLQISWARAIQEQRFDVWRRTGFPASQPVRSLETELRPQLDRLGGQLLRALYLAAPELAHGIDNSRVTVVLQRITTRLPMENQSGDLLRSSLLQFKAPLAGQLTAIQSLKVLRIGTTGDYAPFSLEANEQLSGVDITLALRLAQSLGAEAHFVRTSWPTLMSDLQQRRFDIAASGISITPERANIATFSPAYHRDGKTPIARCNQRNQFATVLAINQPTVRVIVNPGGTNEKFARDNLSRAQLRVHNDNKSIFEELIAGRADVMITDATEADLQARKHPSLCRTTEQVFTQADKAMLLPQQAELASFTDTWLRGEIERGTVRTVLQQILDNVTPVQ